MRSKLKMRQRLAEHSSRTPEISIGSRVTEAGALRKALPASRTGRSRGVTSHEAARANNFAERSLGWLKCAVAGNPSSPILRAQFFESMEFRPQNRGSLV